MEGGYIAGLTRAIQAARELARLGRAAGQEDGGPAALEQLAHVLETEADREETPALGIRLCAVCGAPRPEKPVG